MNKVRFEPFEVSTEVQPGDTIMDAAQRCNIDLTNQCGGKGVCGRCRVKVLSGPHEVSSQALGHLTRRELEKGVVLACQTMIQGDLVVDVPRAAAEVEEKILTEGAREPEPILSYSAPASTVTGPEVEPGYLNPLVNRMEVELTPPSLSDSTADLERLKRCIREITRDNTLEASRECTLELAENLRKWDWRASVLRDLSGDTPFLASVDNPRESEASHGLAVDVGTTTVVVQLVDLRTGHPVDARASHNEQIRYGEDVISRMVFACGKGGLKPLRQAVVENLNRLTRDLLAANGLGPDDIDAVVAAGNTTMSHILYGLMPCHIRLEPYIPTVEDYPRARAGAMGLTAHPEAPVLIMPSVASYVGGDIVAGVLASGLASSPKISVLMDIGTNGEIVVGNNEWMMTCAASAGPAFEGGGLACGMRASSGAVEKVDLSAGACRLNCVGNAAPLGICGSGIISTISALLKEGLLTPAGKLVMDKVDERMGMVDGEPAFFLYRGGDGDIFLTESDMGNLIKSKGAVFAALKTMLDSVGLGLKDIDRLFVAGGFGSYLDLEEAVAIGLLPDIPRDRISFIGNSSLTGARLCLTDISAWRRASELARRMTYMELSATPRYMEEFVASLFLPHTDKSLFPSL